MNKVLESKSQQRSLFTSGAANGQTIVGATSCGTHGSALEFGALHDHIVAIHLIATGNSHFWIERKSRPVMKAAWVAKLGATLKRDDDDLFNAAVVSFGSFGIIGAVVLETVPRYWLDTYPGTAKLNEDLWKVIGGLDFSTHPYFKPDGKKPGGKPYFFQAVINPASDEVLLNANYKKECPADYEPNYDLIQKPGAIGPGFDSLSTVGFILDKFKGVIPKFSKLVAGALFDTKPKTGTSGEIYGFKAPQLHVASGSIAVALADARRTLETLIALYKEIGPVPLVLGLPLRAQDAGPARLQQVRHGPDDQPRRRRQQGHPRLFRRRGGPARGEGNRFHPALGQGERLHQGPRRQGLWRQCRQMAEGAPRGAARRRRPHLVRQSLYRGARPRGLNCPAELLLPPRMPTRETSPSRFVPRSRKVRILATLGPASDSPAMIRRLAEAGADAFRINMSHGTHADHEKRIAAIRALEAELERPTTILADLQGPKLRVGRFAGDKAELKTGQAFVFDRDDKAPGDATRANLPHREIFDAVQPRDAPAGRRRQARLPGDQGRPPTGSRPRSRSAAPSPTTRASTSPTWCCRSPL